MLIDVSRRTMVGATALAIPFHSARAQAGAAPPPRLDASLVDEFVLKAHRPDVDTLKELLTREPALLNAARDWGRGDWETALGAASHTGHVGNALFLLERGARPDLFAAAMLGELATVKAWLGFAPKAHTCPGPHGIPLLSHAISGGVKAEPVFQYLLDQGADVNAAALNGWTPLMQAANAGRVNAVETLLARRADPRIRSKDGSTAHAIAKKKGGQTQIVSLLSAAGGAE